jgi:hypothetical protein
MTDRGRAVAIELIHQFAKSKQGGVGRAPKLMEVYSKMRWDEEKSELLAEELGPRLVDEDADQYSSRRLRLYHEVLDQEWKLESKRIRKEVDDEYERQLKMKADERELHRTLLANSKAAGVDEVDAATVLMYVTVILPCYCHTNLLLSTINSLPYVIASFFQELQRRTGVSNYTI